MINNFYVHVSLCLLWLGTHTVHKQAIANLGIKENTDLQYSTGLPQISRGPHISEQSTTHAHLMKLG